MDGDLVSDHPDPEGVPMMHRVVRHQQRLALVLLVVVESTGSHLGTHLGQCRIPDLNLWRASQVHSAVSSLTDLPVDQHLEVTVFLYRANVLESFPDELEVPVLNDPVLVHLGVCLLLLPRKLSLRHFGTFDRILDQAFPAAQVLPVEDRLIALFLGPVLQELPNVDLQVLAVLTRQIVNASRDHVANHISTQAFEGRRWQGDPYRRVGCRLHQFLFPEKPGNEYKGREGVQGSRGPYDHFLL